MPFIPTKALKKAAQELLPEEEGIRAFHGSPHDFDKFSTKNIGTGEGAQAYGHGLYFAENESVAREYQRALGGKVPPEIKKSMNALDNLGFDSAGQALTEIRSNPNWRAQWDVRPEETDIADKIDEYLKTPTSRMYEVNIKANPDDFLDWDLPLSEQPAALRDYISQADISHLPEGGRLRRTIEAHRGNPGDWVPGEGVHIPEPTGNELHSALTNYGNDGSANAKLADAMRKSGIPGIKYRDAGSRGKDGKATYNYVVFDDKNIEIIKKYGLAGAIASGLLTVTPADEAEAAPLSRIAQAFEASAIPVSSGAARAIPKGTAIASQYDDPDPTLWETTVAAVQRENFIGSYVSSERIDMNTGDFFRVDPDYDVFDDIEGYEEHEDRFLNVFNKQARDAIAADIDREARNDKILDASGWTGVGLSMGAAIFDLPTLIPGAAFVNTGKVGFHAGKSALKLGTAAAGATALQEAGLQATQETRPLEESALNVTASAALGAFVGYGAARYFSKADTRKFTKALEEDLEIITEGAVPDAGDIATKIVSRMQSAGAASVDEIDISDLDIGVRGGKGKRSALVAKAIANATDYVRYNPGIHTMLSPSVKTRELYAKALENPIYTKQNMEGETLGPGAESLGKRFLRGGLGEYLRDQKSIFRDMRKSGEKITYKQFKERVGHAMDNNDTDPQGNQFISRAAKSARSHLSDPLLKIAQTEVKLIDKNIKVSGAASHFHRVWNTNKLKAPGEEVRFKEVVKKEINEQIDGLILKNEEIDVGEKVIKQNDIQRQFNRALQDDKKSEEFLGKRKVGRESRLDSIKLLERKRFDALKDRAPKEVVDALTNMDNGEGIIDAIRQLRSAGAEVNKLRKYPAIDMLRKAGGVKVGSPLASELSAMGVNQKTFPGLFKKSSGIERADNFSREIDDPFKDTGGNQLDADADIDPYISEEEFLDAVASEVAGSPVRNQEDALTEEAFNVIQDNVEEYLESIGLPKTAKIGDVRKKVNEILGAEKTVADLDSRIANLEQRLEKFDSETDKILDRKKVTAAKATELGEKIDALEKELVDAEPLIQNSKRISNMIADANDKVKIAEHKSKLGPMETKVRDLERVGEAASDAQKLELNALKTDIDRLKKEIASLEKIVERRAPFIPTRADDVDAILDDVDREGYVEEIVNNIYNNITGKAGTDTPEWMIPEPKRRGPMKERTFKIDNSKVNEWLEKDAELVMRRYTRSMVGEISAARASKYNDPSWEGDLEDVAREYTTLREKVNADKNLTAKQKAKKLKRLDNYEIADTKALESFRDMLRGTYRQTEESGWGGTVTRSLLAYSYTKLLGGVLLTSIPDVGKQLSTYGLRSVMLEGIPELARALKGVRVGRDIYGPELRLEKGASLSIDEARELGAVAESILNTRLATMAELRDPYAYGNRYEKFISNLTTTFSKYTGLGYWNDTMKAMSSVMAQNRIIRNSLKGDYSKLDDFEKSWMAWAGIDESMSKRIAKEFNAHGEQQGRIYVANTHKWDDEQARDYYAAALNKDVDSTIITKGYGDQPLWTRSNVGKIIMQFKSFGMASHQRTLIRGLQERPHRFMEGLMFATMMGMLVAYAKHLERGEVDKANKLLDNPGLWIADGLDRSGYLALLFGLSNTAEKWGSPYNIKAGIQTMFGEDDQDQGLSRYYSRNKAGTVLGPSFGALQDAATLFEQISQGDLKKSGANAAIRAIPGASLPGIKSGMYIGGRPMLQELVE